MNETVAIEAVRAASVASAQQTVAMQPTVDPAAVAAFSQAMQPTPVGEIPFATQVQAAWNTAEVAHQTHLHRMEALSDLALGSTPSIAGLSQLQYEAATMAFQLEVTTSVAKKASDAVSTLVKNG